MAGAGSLTTTLETGLDCGVDVFGATAPVALVPLVTGLTKAILRGEKEENERSHDPTHFESHVG